MAVSSTPATPAPIPTSSGSDGVRVATQDLVITNNQPLVPIDSMADLIFQDIGGHEIISISRNDLVNGRNISYQLIRNLEDVSIEYNPQNILPVPNGSSDYFNSFPIRFNEYIPTVMYDDENQEYYYLETQTSAIDSTGQNIYIESGTGDLIIDLINLKNSYLVEVEIVSKATIEDDTIYI